MEEIDVAILGAGIAGLGAALKAKEANRAAVIFEARKSAGGLLDNFEIDGFLFDQAVHLSFASEAKVRSIFDKCSYLTHPAESKCFEKGNWLRHPVQNNLYPLSTEEKVDLIESFVLRPNLTQNNYENWLLHQYGEEIAVRFPIKYTKKYWCTDPINLSTTWIGERMRRAEIKEILLGAFTEDTPNTYYTKEMRYPVEGGYKSFIKPLITSSEIQLDSKVTRINIEDKTIEINGNQKIKYSTLVSTLPLPVIIPLIQNAPAVIANLAKKLIATSIDLISIGVKKKIETDIWIYLYDDDILARRMYSPTAKSALNAPEGCASFQFEIYSRGITSVYAVNELKENCTYALKKMGICNEEEIIFIDHKRVNYGNVIFELGMESDRDKILQYLKSVDVQSKGRFGEWDYLWSNQSFMSGYSVEL